MSENEIKPETEQEPEPKPELTLNQLAVVAANAVNDLFVKADGLREKAKQNALSKVGGSRNDIERGGFKAPEWSYISELENFERMLQKQFSLMAEK